KMFEFKIKNSYKKARSGFFNTPHGKLETPNLAIVATHGKIKLLNKTEHLRANPDLIIANTFHLFVNNKVKEIKGSGGLHQWSSFQKPIMTDSGGFQVFSLGWGKIHG
ncbi:tRNA-guanine transglycosylase, partial [Candidatus Wolfebacteria bacterium]|nr:tRNA-guanine transglycosylase [Candidatus Wolfebacteria bacterium]